MQEHIGILGLGNYSTLFYLQHLNELYQWKHGGYSTCPFKMVNADFNRINPYLPFQFDILEPVVLEYIKQLEGLNVKAILVPNITLHSTLDRLNIETPLFHPLQLAAESLKEDNINEVTIFGTRHTMLSDYISHYLLEAGVIVTPPSEQDLLFIDDYRKAVYSNMNNSEMDALFEDLVSQYDHALIACTELSIVNVERSMRNTTDMAQLQISKAVEFVSEAQHKVLN